MHERIASLTILFMVAEIDMGTSFRLTIPAGAGETVSPTAQEELLQSE
jgi:hypothetical protein